MTKMRRNAPCPCGSGKKYKKCCLLKISVPETEAAPPIVDIGSIKATSAPLLENVPNIFLVTPWSHHQLSAGFCASMVNLALTMPFPARFSLFKARHTADARNAACLAAIEEGDSHILMIDADHLFPDDLFLKLWRVLEEHGHDNAIASGWATIRGGLLEGDTSVLLDDEKGFIAFREEDIPEGVFRAYSVGAPCLLFNTAILGKVRPPWFADFYIIDSALESIEDPEDPGVLYWPLERRMTHDFTFGVRMTEAGVKIMVDSKCKLPHEIVTTI